MSISYLPLGDAPEPQWSVETFPAPLTPLVGREADIDAAISMLEENHVRLLTLTGPGGIGKTRLAIELARQLAPGFRDGARFISLEEARDAALLPDILCMALHIRQVGGMKADERLVGVLRDAQMLLVLDNLEHLANTGPQIRSILGECPGITAIVTSRSRLHVSGEQVFPVPPLNMFASSDGLSPAEISQAPAVRLFVERTRSVVPGFTLDAENVDAVVAICEAMDGLPLAIELAATQSAVLSPAALLERISSHRELPLSGPRDLPDRHRTLHDVIGWSYELLSPAEKAILERCSVFAGSFDVDAMTGLLKALDTTADPLAVLAALVEASLLTRVDGSGQPAFRMLETIRAFAWDEAVDAGEARALSEAHAAWCAGLVERSHHAALVPGAEEHLRAIARAYPNVIRALEWLHDRGDGARLTRLAVVLGEYWYESSLYRDAVTWLQRALTLCDAAPVEQRAMARVTLNLFRILQGHDHIVSEDLEAGLDILRRAADPTDLALALVWRGVTAIHFEQYVTAEAALEEALSLAAAMPDGGLSAALSAKSMANLGVVAHERGDFALAMVRYELALSMCQEQGYRTGMARSLRDLGDVCRDMGRHAQAVAYYRKSVSINDAATDRRILMDALRGVALAAATWGMHEPAARLLGAAEALAEQVGTVVMVEMDRNARDRAIDLVRSGLEGQAFRRLWEDGRKLSREAALRELLMIHEQGERLPSAGTEPDIQLSRRERDVLRLVAKGYSDREIAEELFLSIRTVEGHVGRLRAKLGVRSRTAAVTTAMAAGLLDR